MRLIPLEGLNETNKLVYPIHLEELHKMNLFYMHRLDDKLTDLSRIYRKSKKCSFNIVCEYNDITLKSCRSKLIRD